MVCDVVNKFFGFFVSFGVNFSLLWNIMDYFDYLYIMIKLKVLK